MGSRKFTTGTPIMAALAFAFGLLAGTRRPPHNPSAP